MATPAFKSFDPPAREKRIALECGGYPAKSGPNSVDSVASFRARLNGGERKQLFRRTQEQPSYEPYDLGLLGARALWESHQERPLSHSRQDVSARRTRRPDRNPLHGLGWLVHWNVVEQSAQHCRIQLVHRTNAAWPSPSREPAFQADGRRPRDRAHLDETMAPIPMPLWARPASVHSIEPQGTASSAGRRRVAHDEQLLPTTHAQLPPQWDLGPVSKLDGAFMDTASMPEGRRHGALAGRQPARDRQSDNMGFLVVYNEPEENFVCIEPVSHMTDAITFAAHGRCRTRASRSFAPGASVTPRTASQPAPADGVLTVRPHDANRWHAGARHSLPTSKSLDGWMR